MATPRYDIRKSIIGSFLGLDQSEDATGAYMPHLQGTDLMGLRLYQAGKSFQGGADYKIGSPHRYVTFFDDFTGKTLAGTWNANVGSDGSAAAALHADQNGGAVRLTTGAGSTHTEAVNGSGIVANRNFLVSNGGLVCEWRAGKISALTSQSIYLGLTDADTLLAPFTITGTTVTANATNAAGFVEDAAATGGSAKLNAVAVNAGGSGQSVNLGIDVDTAAFHLYRVEIDALGNAMYYVDGAWVATIALAVATTSLLAPALNMFSEATTGSQTIDADYVWAQSVRV